MEKNPSNFSYIVKLNFTPNTLGGKGKKERKETLNFIFWKCFWRKRSAIINIKSRSGKLVCVCGSLAKAFDRSPWLCSASTRPVTVIARGWALSLIDFLMIVLLVHFHLVSCFFRLSRSGGFDKSRLKRRPQTQILRKPEISLITLEFETALSEIMSSAWIRKFELFLPLWSIFGHVTSNVGLALISSTKSNLIPNLR